MDDRMVYVLAGMLVALVAGGLVMERLATPAGTTGTLRDVLPAARARARAWAPRAVLVGLEGRDLVDGQGGDLAGWEFLFADPEQRGRLARVLLGSHVVALRELPSGSVEPSGGPFEDHHFGDTRKLARRLVAYGMRPRSPATFSLEGTGSAAGGTGSAAGGTGSAAEGTGSAAGGTGSAGGGTGVFRVSTAGRLAATWWVDAFSGDLLDYRAGPSRKR